MRHAQWPPVRSTAVSVMSAAEQEQAPPPPPSTRSWSRAWEDIVEGFKQRELWGHLGWQDIKQRYRRSVIGPLWITLSMAITAIGLGLLYSQLFEREHPDVPAVRHGRLHRLELHVRLPPRGHGHVHPQRGPDQAPAGAADGLRAAHRVAAHADVRPQPARVPGHRRHLLERPDHAGLPDLTGRRPAARHRLEHPARHPGVRPARGQRRLGRRSCSASSRRATATSHRSSTAWCR